MEPAVDGDSDGESLAGTWFYNQGRSCYSVSLNEDDDFCFSQQMSTGTVLRGVLAPLPDTPAEAVADGERWEWEAVLTNQARIRLRRQGPGMLSTYLRMSSDGWTPPQHATKRQPLTKREVAADRDARRRKLLYSAVVECGGNGRPLGLCGQCGRCAGWTFRELSPRQRDLFADAAGALGVEDVDYERDTARRGLLPSISDPVPSFNGVKFNFQKAPWNVSVPRTESKFSCGRCGCPEHVHCDVSRRLGRFFFLREEQRAPVPLAALQWTQLEVGLWGDTDGLFKPLAPGARRARAVLNEANTISVICPTTSSRRCFHPFMWSCFRSQTLEPRELVIVETCEDGPSTFFEEKASSDPRVVYKYYHVPPWQWSIGVKRNLACYYATGRIIAHFDDDDLYAPIYLEEMVKCLRDPKEAFFLHAQQKLGQNVYLNMLAGLGVGTDFKKVRKPTEVALAEETLSAAMFGFGAGLAKLSSWHTFSIQKQGWGFFDAIGGDDEPLEDVSNSLYGWGFSMVYLRAAWELCPFLHMNLGEDLEFVETLRKIMFPVILVPDRRGICAHTHHADNTAGGLEFADYGSSSALLYSPMGGLINGYSLAIKALQKAQEQQLEEGRSRRDAEGNLRKISNDATLSTKETTVARPDPLPQATPVKAAILEEYKAKLPRHSRASEAPAPQQHAPPPNRYSLTSSADGFETMEDMIWDGSCFHYMGRLSHVGERFHLLKDGNREAILYPSVPDADLEVAHVIQGPDAGGRNSCWQLRGRGGDEVPCEVVLSCPLGWPLSLTWSSASVDAGEQPADSLESPQLEPGARLGQWKLLWQVGLREQASPANYLAEASSGQRALVSFPVRLQELHVFAAARGLPGALELLEYGQGPRDGLWRATPSPGEHLETLLGRCDHDGLGGRLPWTAVQHLGRVLLDVLKGLHSRGLVLGRFSLSGVYVNMETGQASIVDFSRARPLWAEPPPAEPLGVEMDTLEFDSIRSGFSDDRSPADDLESLGWLLWRCLLGPLPWSRLAAAGVAAAGEERREVRERVAKAKREVCRRGWSVFGPHYSYCPSELENYMRTLRGINELGSLKAARYTELADCLGKPQPQPTSNCFYALSSASATSCFRAADGRVLWWPAGKSSSSSAVVISGAESFFVVTTGNLELVDGGHWAEVANVWAPGMPLPLLSQKGQVLVADWAGQLLEPAPGRPSCGEAPCAGLTKEDWLIDVLGPRPKLDRQGGRETKKVDTAESEEEEEVPVNERERQVSEIAALAARQYTKVREQL